MRRLRASVWASLAIARLDLKGTLGRVPTLFTLLLSTCMSLVVFYLILSDGIAGSKARLLYLVPGLIATLSMSGMSSVSSRFQSDKQSGTLVLLLLSPASPRAVLVGHLISFVVQILVQATVLFFVAAALAGRLAVGGAAPLLGAAAAVVAGALCFASVGASISLLNPLPALSQIPIMIVMSVSIIGSTAYFTMEHVPKALRGLARVNPISYMSDAMRFGICLECRQVDWTPLGILALETAAALAIALLACRQIERRADV